jgi:hypothetical protein
MALGRSTTSAFFYSHLSPEIRKAPEGGSMKRNPIN